MQESEKENLFDTLQSIIDSAIEEKRKEPKNRKNLNTFKLRANIGLQMTKDNFFWLNLIADKGMFKLNRDKLAVDYDFVVKIAPVDLLYFINGQNSTIHMLTKNNEYGKKKVVIEKGTTGKNLLKFRKLTKILVIKSPKTTEIPGVKPAMDKSKIKAKKLIRFTKYKKIITATLIIVIIPQLLTIAFMSALGTIGDAWDYSEGNIGAFYSMVIFNMFNMIYEMPLLAKGYWIVMISWAVPGLFAGLITRDFLKSIIIGLVGIIINVIIYIILIPQYVGSFPPDFIDSLIINGLYYPGLITSWNIPISLLAQITFESFALPILILFILVGGLINPKPEIYTIFDSKKNIRIKQKFKGNRVPKKKAPPGAYTGATPIRKQTVQQTKPVENK